MKTNMILFFAFSRWLWFDFWEIFQVDQSIRLKPTATKPRGHFKVLCHKIWFELQTSHVLVMMIVNKVLTYYHRVVNKTDDVVAYMILRLESCWWYVRGLITLSRSDQSKNGPLVPFIWLRTTFILSQHLMIKSKKNINLF